ncbi:hypothetical protein ACVRYP_05880 [Streptococcus rifensis]
MGYSNPYFKWLKNYLVFYLLLNVLVAVLLLAFERGWILLTYLWVMVPHLPIFLLGVLAVYVAHRSQNRSIWLLPAILFVLSNAWWFFFAFTNGYWQYLFFVVLTVIPIVCSWLLYAKAPR